MGVKRLLTVILVLWGLGAVVPGCRHALRYDERLTAVDSLMKDNPDSALALVEDLSPSDLPAESDRAYRDLLLTQARYKSYVTATSDSDINRALAWFRAHPADREKLTRAYIFKGAVMDELGHPDSAMFYYKTAEATAAPDDYFNLGYAKMRIATLYQDQYSQDTVAIIYKKQAIQCFEIIGDTNFLISCYGDLGGLCGVKYPDSTEYYLTHAIKLAQLINSTKQYTYKSRLAGFYFFQYEDYPRAKTLSMDVLRNGKAYSKDSQFYYYAALSYLRMGMIDSARFVLNATPAPIDVVDSMNWHQVVAEIAKAEKNLISYCLHYTRSKDNQVYVMANSDDGSLKDAEAEYHRIHNEQQVAQKSRDNQYLTIALLIAALIMSSLVGLTFYLKHTIRKNDEIRKQEIKVLDDTITGLKNRQRTLLQMQGSVSELLGYRIKALNELLNSIKFKDKAKEKNKDRARSVIPLSSVIEGMSRIYQPLDVQLSDKFWDKLKRSLDGEYKGIITYIESNYPNLTEREMQLLCLSCANLSPQIIRMCMNYTNVKSVFNNKNIIVRNKMGLNMTFDEFVKNYLKNEISPSEIIT